MYPKDLVSQHRAPSNLPRQQAVADDADGDILEATLQQMLEHEEMMNGFQSSLPMSQVPSGNEHGPPVISGSHLQNPRPNYVWVPGEEDFLEENDLLRSYDDEYLDREVLPRPLAPSTQVQATVSALRGSHQARMQPPSSGSLGGSSSRNYNNMNENPLIMKIEVSVSVPSEYIEGLSHTHPPAAASVEELRNVGTSNEQGLTLQRRSKRGRSSLQLEGRSSKVSRRLA